MKSRYSILLGAFGLVCTAALAHAEAQTQRRRASFRHRIARHDHAPHTVFGKHPRVGADACLGVQRDPRRQFDTARQPGREPSKPREPRCCDS